MSLTAIRSQKGQAVVEMTFTFILFMAAVFAIIEFSHLLYTKINLQHALSEAGRYMVTGQGLDLSGSNPNARLQVVQNKFCDNLIATGLSCANVTSGMSVTCVGGCTQPAGGPGQTVTLTVTVAKPWMTILFDNLVPGPVTLTSNTTWINEKYM
jgi:Flp pilus assembly protein TadG